MKNATDLWPTKDCYCLAARREARALTRLYEKKLRPHGLRATQFSVLAALALKGPTPVSELAEFLGLDRTSLTRNAVVLERNDWVTSERSQDARERLLRLTLAGRRKVEAAFPAWREVQDLLDRQGPPRGSKGRVQSSQL